MTHNIIVCESVQAVRAAVSALKLRGKKVGFVPTMGYLHEGHVSLVRLAAKTCDAVVASIFVNPTQFNDPKDLEAYPRDIPRDLQLLEQAGTAAVFLPTPAMMYGSQFESWVELQKLPLQHEGAHRPGHFRGVSTVVAMLFNAVQPDAAVFGEKDFQQLRIIEQMVTDLHFPIQIVRGPLVRESDGLAMSSRNVRLSAEARQRALSISKGLFAAEAAYKKGERSAEVLCALVQEKLKNNTEKVEYVHLVEESTLNLISNCGNMPCRLLVAAFVGGVRLIDNIRLN